VVAGGADDRLHRADDDVGPPVDPLVSVREAPDLDPVIAAQRDDVQLVAGQPGELVLDGQQSRYRPRASGGGMRRPRDRAR
jgi:hypothetical protein